MDNKGSNFAGFPCHVLNTCRDEFTNLSMAGWCHCELVASFAGYRPMFTIHREHQGSMENEHVHRAMHRNWVDAWKPLTKVAIAATSAF